MTQKHIGIVLLIFICIVVVGACFRLPQLELRPVHGDEANQAMKTGRLLEKGAYLYDPHEHHGPSLYYLALPILWASRTNSFADSTISMYRLLPVLCGLACILLFWPMRRAMGNGAMLWAALFLAVSPAMTYYSRYYIQEILLVCCVQGAFACAVLFMHAPARKYVVGVGVFLGLVHATKETSILVAASIFFAAALLMLQTRLLHNTPFRQQGHLIRKYLPVSWLCLGIAAALTVSIVFFSSFFTHWRGPLDSLLTYVHYFDRTDGTGSAGMHQQPWHYYLRLLLYTHRQTGPYWTEGIVLLLAGVGALTTLLRAQEKPDSSDVHYAPASCIKRFLLFYTIAMTIIYALIPYKTPWNLLPFYHGMLLLAGMGASSLVQCSEKWRLQTITTILLLAGTAHLAWQSYQGNFHYPADARNPYVYAHPSTALRKLVDRIEGVAAIAKEGRDLHINIIRTDGDYWPLPWYLRQYGRVGYWHKVPEPADADIILAAPELYEYINERLKNKYLVEFQALRPGVLLHAYIRQDLWDAYMEKRK